MSTGRGEVSKMAALERAQRSRERQEHLSPNLIVPPHMVHGPPTWPINAQISIKVIDKYHDETA